MHDGQPLYATDINISLDDRGRRHILSSEDESIICEAIEQYEQNLTAMSRCSVIELAQILVYMERNIDLGRPIIARRWIDDGF